MANDTPRTDKELRLCYSEGDYFGEETTEEAYEFARELERELNTLRLAVKAASAAFERVSWGYDGDCGSGKIIEKLEEAIQENVEG